MCNKDIRENILETLNRNLLFGNDVIVDDFFCVNLLNDNKIQLVSFVVTNEIKFKNFIKRNNYRLDIPEWVDSIDKNAMKSLEDFSRTMYYNGFKFGIKFPDNMKQIPSNLMSSYMNRFKFIIGKNICEDYDLISELSIEFYDYIYLPNFEVTEVNLSKYSGIHNFLFSSNRSLRVYFKNYQGTLGSLAVLYNKLKIKNYSQRFLNIVSECVRQEYNVNGECICEKSNVYKDIYGICLKDTVDNGSMKIVWQPGVDIELSYIPTWSSSFENYELSDKGKLLLSTGNFKMDKSVTLLSSNCFNIDKEIQTRIGILNIELSPMLKKIDKYSFKDLYCLEGLTVVNKPQLEVMWLYNCPNLKYLNLLSYTDMEFNINTIYKCNESAILNLQNWSGTVKEYRMKFVKELDRFQVCGVL